MRELPAIPDVMVGIWNKIEIGLEAEVADVRKILGRELLNFILAAVKIAAGSFGFYIELVLGISKVCVGKKPVVNHVVPPQRRR